MFFFSFSFFFLPKLNFCAFVLHHDTFDFIWNCCGDLNKKWHFVHTLSVSLNIIYDILESVLVIKTCIGMLWSNENIPPNLTSWLPDLNDVFPWLLNAFAIIPHEFTFPATLPRTEVFTLQTKVKSYSILKVKKQTVSDWQGLYEECELLFFIQRGQWVNVACNPLFLCWEVEHFPLHIYWQLYVHEETKSIMGCPHSWPQLGGLWDKTVSFPRQEKETPSLIGLNGQSGYNRWTYVVGTILLLYQMYSRMRWY